MLRLEVVTDPLPPRPNPEHEWVTREVPGLRIIEDDLWERVQTIKRRYSSRWGNKRQSKKRLFSGLLKCGRCGGGMTISRGDREKGTCDADAGIAVHELEERVLNGLRDILLGNERSSTSSRLSLSGN